MASLREVAASQFTIVVGHVGSLLQEAVSMAGSVETSALNGLFSDKCQEKNRDQTSCEIGPA